MTGAERAAALELVAGELGMSPRAVDALCALVADRITEPAAAAASAALVDVKTLAAALNVSCDYVYEHAAALGGVKLGDGPRAPWRFDLDQARAAVTRRTQRRESPAPEDPHRQRIGARPRRAAETTSGRSLAIRGDEA